MAEEKNKNSECCSGKDTIMNGFKFGFGIYLAFLAGNLILALVVIVIYYLVRALGLGF